jgi:ribosomal protein L20A (L18A)
MESTPALERLIQKKSVSESELRQLSRQVENIARNNIDEFVHKLDIGLQRCGNVYRCPCPIHGGDNPTGFSVATGEYSGVWTCWTHHCEQGKQGLVNLVKLLKNVSTEDALLFILSTTENRNTEWVSKPVEDFKHSETRRDIRRWLDIPSKYYIQKGVDPLILDMYDVGFCGSGVMEDRVVFPIYDITNQYIGCTGRTLVGSKMKWKHHEIKTSNHLYNINFAAPYINQTRTVYLVESTGNVLKLVQNGVKNCLCTFGAHLTDQQKIKLECMDIVRVNILFDNDEAGRLAGLKAKEKLKGFDVQILKIEENDVFDMPDDKVKEFSQYDYRPIGTEASGQGHDMSVSPRGVSSS